MENGEISDMGSQRLVWLIHHRTFAAAGLPCAMAYAGSEAHFIWTRAARPSGYNVRSLRPGRYPVPPKDAAWYLSVGREAPTSIEVGLDAMSGDLWARLHFKSDVVVCELAVAA